MIRTIAHSHHDCAVEGEDPTPRERAARLTAASSHLDLLARDFAAEEIDARGGVWIATHDMGRVWVRSLAEWDQIHGAPLARRTPYSRAD